MQFVKSDSGAVTVDWVVLTAGLVGLGLATMSVVSSGVESASTSVERELSGMVVLASFEARAHSDWYKAYLREFEHMPDGYDYHSETNGDGSFHTDIAAYEAMNEAELAAEIAKEALHRPAIEAANAYLESTDPADITTADYAAIYTTHRPDLTAQQVSNLQAIWDAQIVDMGGDMDQWQQFAMAYNDRQIYQYEGLRDIADEKGYSY